MTKTHWPKVWVAFLAGCIAAFQIGKAYASLALIISELDLTLVQAGLLLSLFSFIAAIAGAGFGLLADRIGHLSMGITGLVISACGAFLGSIAPDITYLILSRMIEGFGFIVTIVSMPSLISRSATDHHRPLVMGLWGAFMPTGTGLSMLLTPVLLEWHGWRGLWNDIGIISLTWAVILYLSFRGTTKISGIHLKTADIISNILKPGPVLVVTGFACYSALYLAVTAFLPTILVTNYSVSISLAAQFGALVVVGNIIGNLSAGWTIGRGATPWKVMTLAFVMMLICATLVFVSFTDPLLKVVFGFLFSAFGGLFPGTAFVLASRFSASPSHMALMTGLLLQGSGIGMTIGPMMVSSVVEYGGNWNYAISVVFLLAGIGLMCAGLLRRQN